MGILLASSPPSMNWMSRARMANPPDLFEIRLDHLVNVVDELEARLPLLRRPVIITARHPREGGANNLSIGPTPEPASCAFCPLPNTWTSSCVPSAPWARSLVPRRIEKLGAFCRFMTLPPCRAGAACIPRSSPPNAPAPIFSRSRSGRILRRNSRAWSISPLNNSRRDRPVRHGNRKTGQRFTARARAIFSPGLCRHRPAESSRPVVSRRSFAQELAVEVRKFHPRFIRG